MDTRDQYTSVAILLSRENWLGPGRLEPTLSAVPCFVDVSFNGDLAGHERNQSNTTHPNPKEANQQTEIQEQINLYAANQFRPHPRQNE